MGRRSFKNNLKTQMHQNQPIHSPNTHQLSQYKMDTQLSNSWRAAEMDVYVEKNYDDDQTQDL